MTDEAKQSIRPPQVGQHIRWKLYRKSKTWKYGFVRQVDETHWDYCVVIRRYQPKGAILGRYETHKLADMRDAELTDTRLAEFTDAAGYTKYGTPAQ